MKHTPPTTFIYALINPLKGTVFYIGRTEDMASRLIQHVCEAKRNPTGNPKSVVIDRILKRGLYPLMEELETCTGYSAPMYAERFWVRQYGVVLNHPVVNRKFFFEKLAIKNCTK